MPLQKPIMDIVSIEPSDSEAANGWTKETLTKYLVERNAVQSLKIDIHNPMRRIKPTSQNHKYKPLRWRR